MPQHEPGIITIGASAGGVEALVELVRGLPSDLPAAVFVVLHVSESGTSALPAILSRAGALPAFHPDDHTSIEPGKIYVAPPGFHLLVRPGHVRVTPGPRENGVRPAIDVLFRTAARVYRERVAGVILSGTLDDGTLGLSMIDHFGGVTIVQDPKQAAFPGMPQSALNNVDVDHCLAITDIPDVLVRFARDVWERPVSIESTTGSPDAVGAELVGSVSGPVNFSCPECGGALREESSGNIVSFRCHVGHAFSSNGLVLGQQETVERALWVAIRTLEEQADLTRRLADRARNGNNLLVAQRFEDRHREALSNSDVVRRVLLADSSGTGATESNMDIERESLTEDEHLNNA